MLTSNATRELSEALKRRCLYLHLDYPDAEREREIVRLAGARTSRSGSPASSSTRSARLRDLELKKAPSIAESVDWARTLVALEIGDLDERGDRPRPSASCSSTPPTRSGRSGSCGCRAE